MGGFVLDLILSGKEKEQMIIELNDTFSKYGQELKNNKIPLF
jgi:hypothetical protein